MISIQAISTAFTEENFGDYNEKTFADIATPEELFDWMQGPLQVRTRRPSSPRPHLLTGSSASLIGLLPSPTFSDPLRPSPTLSDPLQPSPTLSDPLRPSQALSYLLLPSLTLAYLL